MINGRLFDSPEMFLKSSIENILKHSSIKRKEHVQLKKACESALEQLNSENERNSKIASLSGKEVLPDSSDCILADGYFLPFELACQSKNKDIVIMALDSLQKLIAHGQLIGDCPDSVNPDRLLIDRIVQTICFPFQGPHTDDGVQLQVIMAILVVVLSNTCKIHEGSLLLAVRTCFNIYLATRSPVNQSTAKGVLTQTIDAVFCSMERLESETHSHIEVDLDEAAAKSVLDSIVNQIVAGDNCSPIRSVEARSRQSSVSDAVIPNGSISGGFGGNHSSPANLSVNGLITITTSTLDSMIHDEANTAQLEFRFVEEKDAFLIFRALCKLSMKQLPDDPDPKSHELRSKLLSLEMILRIVQNFNMQMSEKHSFLFAIRHFLCLALTHNAVSPIISVFEKALAIFVQLVNKLKVHLKRQIEVFFKEIIISILESLSSSFEHKWVVLNSVSKICDNAQSVVDIYINYDCHLTSANIFETLVRRLSKIASDTTSQTQSNALYKERGRRMRELGLECLIKILQCLSVWYDELHIGKGREPSINGANEVDGGDFCGSASLAGVGGGSHSSSFAAGLDTMSANQLAQVKHQKSIIEHGIELFANKPEKGIRFLQEKGFVGASPADIAHFFHIEERLDQTTIGDYLGDGNEFNKSVMHEYVDAFDFSNITIVQALRRILDKFRLPGEAQKIDRIMEKFASRYCSCNPSSPIFASADTAYVLSYSIIMLTTDLHNPQVKTKMTKEDYIRMNRGINDQSDLPKEFLCEIYDDIAANEIKTRPTNFRRPKLNIAGATWRQRKLVQNIELENIAATAHALMEAASVSQTEFMSATHFEHVRPMFSLMWTPCLAAFSIGLQDSDEEEIWRKCLQGFRCGIRVACVFRMSTEQRNAFVQGLTRFTLLTAKSSLTEMKVKNIESIKLLITIGDEDGNFLDECWYDCLKCISQLELAQLISTGGSGVQSENAKNAFKINEKSLSTLQECLGETSSQSVVVAVDKIFQGSSKLSGEAIVHFVRSLCRVSMEELESPASPRMFMLQKIVEISFYNMNRIRIEWSMIWNVLGEHFNLAGCSRDERITHFALDALRQLSMKFLEKGELPNFRLQKEFLRPFEVIMAKNKSLECREMIIACITHMVQSHADKIRSGWKNVFSVCTIAAAETRETIVNAAFSTITMIMRDVFPFHFIELMDSFQEAIKCLSEFACNIHFPDISMEAIRLIRNAATLVSEHTDLINIHPSDADDHVGHSIASSAVSPIVKSAGLTLSATSCASNNNNISNNANSDTGRVWCKGWFPIIFELSCVIQRCKLDVRTRSLTVMFEIVKTYGNEFEGWWTELFDVIFRIFDFIKHDGLGSEKKNNMENIKNNLSTKEIRNHKSEKINKEEMNDIIKEINKEKEEPVVLQEANVVKKNEWMITTCNHALCAIVDVFTQYYSSLASILLDKIYQQFYWCIQQGSEQLARAAINCLEILVVSNGEKFTDEIWQKTINHIVANLKFAVYTVECEESDSSLSPITPRKDTTFVNGIAADLKSTHNDLNGCEVNGGNQQTSSSSTSPSKEGVNGEASETSPVILCIIHVEMVDAISNILFGRNAFKVEGPPSKKLSPDSTLMNFSDNIPVESYETSELPCMYKYVSDDRLIVLVDWLMRSHSFARTHNNHSRVRSILWKAALLGKFKPNIYKLEAHSIHCVLNILFQLYAEAANESKAEKYKEKLTDTVNHSLDYYLSSHSDTLRSHWLTVIQLLLNRTYDLPQCRFNALGPDYQLSVARLIESEEQSIIRSALHRVLQRNIMEGSIMFTKISTSKNGNICKNLKK